MQESTKLNKSERWKPSLFPSSNRNGNTRVLFHLIFTELRSSSSTVSTNGHCIQNFLSCSGFIHSVSMTPRQPIRYIFNRFFWIAELCQCRRLYPTAIVPLSLIYIIGKPCSFKLIMLTHRIAGKNNEYNWLLEFKLVHRDKQATRLILVVNQPKTKYLLSTPTHIDSHGKVSSYAEETFGVSRCQFTPPYEFLGGNKFRQSDE